MSRKLVANVAVGDVWYGPDYPEAGDPPPDKVGKHVFEGSSESAEDAAPAVSAVIRKPASTKK